MFFKAYSSLQSTTFKKASTDDENFSNINKTKHLTKGENKNTRWKDPCLGEQKFFSKESELQGNMDKSSIPPLTNCQKHI